jgi:hypothetical protein
MILESPSLFRAAAVVAAVCFLTPLSTMGATMQDNASANASASASAKSPTSIDLRPAFAERHLPVRSQGGRGTCSVFTIVGAIEYALAGQQGRGAQLSVEFVNWASNAATQKKADGGFFSDLWAGYAAYGACPEADMPYQAKYDAKARPTQAAMIHGAEVRKAGLRLNWIKPWDVKTGLTDGQFAEIKKTLAAQWPVCGGLRWPKQERWKDGVLEMAPPEGVFDGHSVLLVGFRDDPSKGGGGVFLIRNSGKGLEDGAMSYEYARAYMNDAAWVDYPPKPAAATGPASAPASRPAGAAAAASAAGAYIRGLLSPMGPAPAGRNRRVSSNEQPNWSDGNMDMTWLMPGESVDMPILDGPGVITHMWFTSHAGWVGELNALVLRIYWDGREEPDVEVPLGDFFAVGHGRPASVESVPVQVSPSGSLSCYWRMPFHRTARIVVTNDNPDRSTGLYWQVDSVQFDEPLPEGTPYFHARYRQEYPATAGRNYAFADLAGSGWYVGTVLSVTSAQDGWFGEGDDYFYIDGEKVPSLQGTGSEDYFNDAWGFRVRTGPWFGQPRWQGDRAGDCGVCYRWHLPDAVNFTTSLRVEMEHKGNRDDAADAFFIERPDLLSSVAMWYQTGPAKAWGELPPWPQRRVPWEHTHFVRAFRNVVATGDAAKPRVDTTGFFGARPVLVWPSAAPGAEMTIPFTVAAAGRYAVRLTAGTTPDGGAYDVGIDGRRVLSADLRAAEAGEADLLLGTHVLAAGEHTITFAPAASPADRPGPLTVEMLRILRLPPEAQRTVRTHNEAHFVRLAIGRAVYAFRLAFDTLPDSLQTLVDAGLMPARYLADENFLPLTSRIDDGFVVVQSPAPGGWEHRWQGLDARR